MKDSYLVKLNERQSVRFHQFHAIGPIIRLPARQLRLRNDGRRGLKKFVDEQFQSVRIVRMQRVGRDDDHVFHCAKLSKADGEMRGRKAHDAG
jgi:hypothetical protein